MARSKAVFIMTNFEGKFSGVKWIYTAMTDSESMKSYFSH